LTTKEQILEEAFKIPWTFPLFLGPWRMLPRFVSISYSRTISLHGKIFGLVMPSFPCFAKPNIP